MRKRHVARPRLESMEDRLTLSAMGAAAPTAEVHATRVTRLEAHKAQEAAIRAAKHADHDHAVKHRTTTSKTSSKSTSTNIFTQFFKSAFSGL
jgi:hypothetical protein